MRFSMTIMALLVSVSSFAQVQNVDGRLKRISATEEACMANASSTMAINGCSSDKLEASDKLLNEVYQDKVKSLKAQALNEKNVSEFEKYADETLRRLVKAQRAWIVFRDADCELQGTSMLHGTGENTVILGCLAEKTHKRVKEISDL